MSPVKWDAAERAARIKQWKDGVLAIAEQAQEWSAEQGWAVARQEKQVHEELLGDYEVPQLRIRVSDGELLLNPVGLHVIGAEGRIDLEAWPSLNRVKLVRHNDVWEVYTDSNVPLRRPWSKETFVQLAKDLVSTS